MHRGQQHIRLSEAQPDLPCLSLRLCLLPSAPHLPYFHHIEFFFQFFKYIQLAPASGPLHLLFLLLGRLSSSSSTHGTEVLGQMSLPGTSQSPTQLCHHPLPSHSFYCSALLYLHCRLFHYICCSTLSRWSIHTETKTRSLLSPAISSAPRAVSACTR